MGILVPSATSPSDADLIRRWRGGDSRAATQLVERHGDAVARFVASQGERDEAGEVVQDTFVRAFGALDSFRGDSTFRTWLFTIARRLLLDRRRAVRRRRDTVELGDADVTTESTPLDTMVADESLRRVELAVAALSPKQRDVFTLRVEQGLSYREIAELTGSTEGATRVHYHNAMRAVKEFLNDE